MAQVTIAIDQALPRQADDDRKVAALATILQKKLQDLDTHTRLEIASELCPNEMCMVGNARQALARLKGTNTSQGRAAALAILAGLIDSNISKKAAMDTLGVGRKAVDRAIAHRQEFNSAATAVGAAAALAPPPR